ncbi:MAG: DoxX family protein [Spirochaetia bacterium]|nr:DoxX family protein [Spirochaetia bacterium]
MKILFWITTVLFSLAMGMSGVNYLTANSQFMAGLQHLGYPAYFHWVLGVAKPLGVIALLLPVPARLKEWAYAGFTFNLLAASFSHGMSGDKGMMIAAPLILLLILGASYYSFRKTKA